jgi:hypothetical protein
MSSILSSAKNVGGPAVNREKIEEKTAIPNPPVQIHGPVPFVRSDHRRILKVGPDPRFVISEPHGTPKRDAVMLIKPFNFIQMAGIQGKGQKRLAIVLVL